MKDQLGKARQSIEGAESWVARLCPACGHVFQGNGFDGIDAHWRARHEGIEPYSLAWPKIRVGKWTPPNRKP